jgi:hypothetical protein
MLFWVLNELYDGIQEGKLGGLFGLVINFLHTVRFYEIRNDLCFGFCHNLNFFLQISLHFD